LIYRYFHEKPTSRSAVQSGKWHLIGKGYWWCCTAHQAAIANTPPPQPATQGPHPVSIHHQMAPLRPR